MVSGSSAGFSTGLESGVSAGFSAGVSGLGAGTPPWFPEAGLLSVSVAAPASSGFKGSSGGTFESSAVSSVFAEASSICVSSVSST